MPDLDLAIQQLFTDPLARYDMLNMLMVELAVDIDDLDKMKTIISEAEKNPARVRVLTIILHPEMQEMAMQFDGATDLYAAFLRLRDKKNGNAPEA